MLTNRSKISFDANPRLWCLYLWRPRWSKQQQNPEQHLKRSLFHCPLMLSSGWRAQLSDIRAAVHLNSSRNVFLSPIFPPHTNKITQLTVRKEVRIHLACHSSENSIHRTAVSSAAKIFSCNLCVFVSRQRTVKEEINICAWKNDLRSPLVI